eukprot:873234-Amphidinium_carterae.1
MPLLLTPSTFMALPVGHCSLAHQSSLVDSCAFADLVNVVLADDEFNAEGTVNLTDSQIEVGKKVAETLNESLISSCKELGMLLPDTPSESGHTWYVTKQAR